MNAGYFFRELPRYASDEDAASNEQGKSLLPRQMSAGDWLAQDWVVKGMP